MTGRLRSVNVGTPRTVPWHGRDVTSAIWKSPVVGPVRVEGVNLAGDDQADRRVHGGTDKAVYAYAAEDYEWWSAELLAELEPGTFGENLTTEGVEVTGAVVGARWRVGTALLEVAQPRMPCAKLGMRMGDAAFRERFGAARRSGAYLRIVEPGAVAAGDAIEVVDRPGHGLRVLDIVVAEAEPTTERLERIAAVSDVAEGWRDWAARALARSGR